MPRRSSSAKLLLDTEFLHRRGLKGMVTRTDQHRTIYRLCCVEQIVRRQRLCACIFLRSVQLRLMSNNRSKFEHSIQRAFSAVSVSPMWPLRIIVDQPPMEIAKPSLSESTFSPARVDLSPKAVRLQPFAAVMVTDFTRTAP